MFVMKGLFLAALFQLGLSTAAGGSNFCSKIEALHVKARLSAIPTAEEEQIGGNDFHSMDFVVGKSLLDLCRMSFDRSGVLHSEEDRLLRYARSCSRPFIDALFSQFKSEMLFSPQQNQLDELDCEISEMIVKLFTAESKLEEIQEFLSAFARRYGRVNAFIEKMINRDLNPYAYARIENFSEKEAAVCDLAANLRDCPEEDIDQASEALIGFLRIVAKDQTALGVFDLCQNARIKILEKRPMLSRLTKARKEAERLVHTHKNRLDELIQMKNLIQQKS